MTFSKVPLCRRLRLCDVTEMHILLLHHYYHNSQSTDVLKCCYWYTQNKKYSTRLPTTEDNNRRHSWKYCSTWSSAVTNFPKRWL